MPVFAMLQMAAEQPLPGKGTKFVPRKKFRRFLINAGRRQLRGWRNPIAKPPVVMCFAGTSSWRRAFRTCTHSFGEGKNGIVSSGLVDSSVGKSNNAIFAAIAAAKATNCQAVTGGFSVPPAAMNLNTP